MAGDQNLVWSHGGGGAAFSPPASQPLPHCHSPAPLYGNPLIPGYGSASLLPVASATAPSLLDLQDQLLTELIDDTLGTAGCDQSCYAPEWGVLPYSFAGSQPEVSCIELAAPLVDVACFSPSMEETFLGKSSADQLNGPLLSSTAGAAANFYPSYYHEPAPYSSAAPFTGSQAISGSASTTLPPAATASYGSSEQDVFYYPSGGQSLNNPPATNANGSTTPPMAAAAASVPLQADVSERNDLDISVIWTPEEQHLLDELYNRFGHIECPVVRFAKIARPFPGKRIRDVALRIRWMEEQRNQKTKAVNSSRSHRGMRVPGRSRDPSRHSSQPGNPY